MIYFNKEELEHKSKLPWYSKSVDSNYLTGKRVLFLVMEHMQLLQPKLQRKNWVLK